MLNLAVARRYAQALFSLAQEQSQIEQIEQDLALVMAELAANPELGGLMRNQLIAPKVKWDLVEQAFAARLSALSLNFLGVVIKRRREPYLKEIHAEFVSLADEARGLVEVRLRGAADLPEASVASLRGALETRLGKQVRFTAETDPTLMGGLVVQVGDTLMDGSVRTRLRRLGERLRRVRVKE